MLKQFRERIEDTKIATWDIFHHVYGPMHHPGYRTKFADNLKRELPRIPFAPDFWAFAKADKQLADLHLNSEQIPVAGLSEAGAGSGAGPGSETPATGKRAVSQTPATELEFVYSDGVPLSYVVEKMKLSKDKTSLEVNESLTLARIPPQVFVYRLGNRSALEWVIDQYQVSEDTRSGIKSDPNRPDDEQYIVRLVGQVVRVSLETVKIVAGLPVKYSDS